MSYCAAPLSFFFLSFLTALLLPLQQHTTRADVTHIKTADDLIDLSEAVHQGGRTFAGETVVLEADIDMNTTTRRFYPIGRCTSPTTLECSSFNGVFEGQGHVIRNIHVISDDDIVLGLFGYTSGAVIRDVIIDTSCNFTLNAGSAGTYGAHFSYVIGGVVAACNALTAPCVVERCVSRASVVAVGDLKGRGNVVMGAVAGVFRPHANNSCVVRDCVTQGKMYLEVSNGNESRVGGVIGLCKGQESAGDDVNNDVTNDDNGTGTCEIKNSLNYGTIIHNEVKGTTPFNVGDIVGEIKNQSFVINCVSLGTFSYLESFFYAGGCYGAIVGDVTGGTPTVRSCYWPLTTIAAGPVGRGANRTTIADVAPFDSSRELTVPVGSTTSLVEALNAGALALGESARLWSLLRFYTDSSGGTYTPALVLNTHPEDYVELPVPLKTSAVFNTWCTDVACKTPFSLKSLAEKGSHGEILLYAKYDVVIDSPEALARLSEYVANGNTYAGITVYLACDLDMSAVGASFAPIGRYIATGSYFPFNGVFDGRGYVISNLRIVSEDAGVGLFAYSTGATVRNLVLDGSCSVTSTCALKTYDSAVSAVLSNCLATDAPCVVESVVSAASVAALGDIAHRKAFVGGIGGFFSAKTAPCTIRNCAVVANTVLRYAGSCSRVRIGGICGYVRAAEPAMALNATVENCLFEGTVEATPALFTPASPDEPTRISVGGVIGTADYGSLVRNCAANILRLTSRNASSSSSAPIIVDEANFGCVAGDLDAATAVPTLATHSYCSKVPDTCDILSLPLVGSVYNGAQQTDLGEYNESTGLAGSVHVSSLLNQGRAVLPPLLPLSAGWGQWTLVRLDPRPGHHYRAQRLFLGGNPGRYAYLPAPQEPEGFIFVGWFADTAFTTPAVLNELVSGKDDVAWAYARYVRGTIVTPQDFVDFAAAVNSGFDHYNKTVVLAADLDLSQLGPLAPITGFRGIFDGKGHVIDGLTLNTSAGALEGVGLFGHSTGATVQNVILGPECTVTAKHSANNSFSVAGIFGACTATTEPCVIRSCVTLANVKCTDDSNSGNNNNVYIGGIAGLFRSATNIATVSNCANHGSITYNCENSGINLVYIGGIIGSCQSNSNNNNNKVYGQCTIENSLFSGSIHYSGPERASGVTVGGIVGTIDANNDVHNCAAVSGFALPSALSGGSGNYYGAIIGSSEGPADAPSNEVSNCYWLAGAGTGTVGSEDDDAGAGAFGKNKLDTSEISYVTPFKDTYLFDERIISGGTSTKSLITALNSHISAVAGSAKWSMFSFVKKSGKNKEVKVSDNVLLLQTGLDKIAPLIVPTLPPLDGDSTAVFLGWYVESVVEDGKLVPVNFTLVEPGKTTLYPMWNATSAAPAAPKSVSLASFIVAAVALLVL